MFQEIIEDQNEAPLSQQRMQDLKIVGIQIEDAFESAELSERNVHSSNKKSPKTLKRRKQNKDLIDI